MPDLELTVEQKMELAISKAQEQRKRVKDNARLKLLENVDYVNYKASVLDEVEQVAHLTAIADNLNQIKTITTNDGSKYAVHCYPVAEYVFGPVMSRVVGIITASSAMFTDERQLEFQAITGVSHLEASKARDAIGSPAYYSKGQLAPTIVGNGEDLSVIITAICDSLGIDLDYASKVNQATINRWCSVAEAKANKQFSEFQQMDAIDSTNKFVLED